MGRAFLGVGLALAAAAAPEEASAGAWVAPESQEIWTHAAGQRDDGFYFYETAAYWEVPVAERTSVVAAPWVEQSYALSEGWRGEAVFGVKHAVFRDDAMVMAVQAGALWRSDPPDGCSERGVELRWLAGRNLGQRSFVNVEAAGRMLEGGCGGERIDLTAGFRPAGNWLAMGQVFADLPHEGGQSVHLQLSVVRFGASGRGIQLGVRARLDDGDAQPALVVGLWGSPGD